MKKKLDHVTAKWHQNTFSQILYISRILTNATDASTK